ncbi:MAG TPA: alpha/beta hydrolase-fold protein [Bryobacteraceae bacterium]|nr:alpha/beta hydrolase-fold protein [Bryobacteraceae bacterium]
MKLLIAAALIAGGCCVAQTQSFYDRTHPSKVFGQERNYRVFLPRSYEGSTTRYPVIYYFHGHSDRYTLEHYDKGKDTVPKIASFVGTHDVIVVSVDGYVARDYSGFYGGSPWDVRVEGGDYDFGACFKELVAHIDSTYRTLTDRGHRGTSGLSMGGFMSLWLSARYPDLIGSASAFNPGPEFYAGEKGARLLWRPRDHVTNHTHTAIRLVRASGDYISQYHEETRDAYARSSVPFEFRQDEYHRHWATSIAETFDFHMRAFGDSAMNNIPEMWSHASPYRQFKVWGYAVESSGEGPAFTFLQDVRQSGLRVMTRRWAPDGPSALKQITIRTAPLYSAGSTYTILDHNLQTGKTDRSEVVADQHGRLTLSVDGAGHQISFGGPGTGGEPPVVLPMTTSDVLRLEPARDLTLPLRIYNPRAQPLEVLKVKVTSEYPTVHVLSDSAEVRKLASGAVVDVSGKLRIRLTSGGGYFLPASVTLVITYDGWHTAEHRVPLLIAPESASPPAAFEVLDGRTMSFSVFRQKGNKGGGESVKRTVTEGRGNGNGILEPGEEATIWVQMRQGMDPFDKNNWYRSKVRDSSGTLVEVADLEEQKQREWTGAKERTSVVRLRDGAASDASVLLENESWSYHYTPDVRYGTERLYQAFQLHTRHLHRLDIKALIAARPTRPR